jgi:hypothetical protein
MTGIAVEHGRIGKLLRLALVADQDGEITGAIHALRRALTTCGLGPHDVVDAFERGAQPIAPAELDDDHDRGQDRDRSDIWFAYHHRHQLSPRDAHFVNSIARWSGPLSDRQRKWLTDICNKLAGEP